MTIDQFFEKYKKFIPPQYQAEFHKDLKWVNEASFNAGIDWEKKGWLDAMREGNPSK